jgi:DNA polymerase elongation subunit (family B)
MSIRFNVVDWREYDIETFNEDEEDSEKVILDNKQYVIELYGRTAKDDSEYPDQSVYLKVLDYYPHFYLRLPDRFTEMNLKSLMEYIIEYLCPKKYQESLISYDLVEKHRFYGFTNNKLYKFGLLVFKNMDAMRKFSYLFSKPIRTATLPEFKYEPHETNISPMLRFMHKQNIKSCGWVSVSDFTESDYANTDVQIEANWKDVIAYDNPKYSSLKVLSFDIECVSEDGSFPQPERKNDKVITICSTITRYGSIEPEEIWAFSLKKCPEFDDPRVKLINCKTEKELLLKWSESVLEIDPDIITGYNISGFDEFYLHKRAILYNVAEKFSNIGRKSESCKFEEQKLSSSALGDNILKFYDTPGRVMIDMLKVVQRDHKLTSYKLDNVAENFIKGDVKKYEVQDNKTILTVTKPHLLKVGNYIKFTVNDEKYKNSEKYIVESITNNQVVIETNDIDFVIDHDNEIKWGLAKDDVKPAELFQLYNEGTEEGIYKITKYCIMDCALINMLIGILEILNNNMAMATVCSVPLAYIFLRGQGIKIFSLVSKACKENNYIVPVIRPKKDEIASEDDSYEGAICFTPQIGFYDVPITVLDYGSLYPSSMIDLNMSLETIVLDDKFRGLKGYKYNEIWYKSDPTIEKPDVKVTFAIPEDNKRGIVPKILQYLLDARNDTRAKQKNVTDSSMFAILEGLQLAYKVTANSLYGQMGAKTSPVHMKEIAASTTARGREMLEFGRDYVEKEFSPVLEKYISDIPDDYDDFFDKITIQHSDVLKPNKLLLKYWEQVFSQDKFELLKKQLENPKENILNEDYLKEEFNKKSRFLEILHKKYFKQYNFEIKPKIIYGDSVTGDTPLLLKSNINDSNIEITTIDSIASKWIPYPGFKADDKKLLLKEQSMPNKEYYVMINDGVWSKVLRVIRHKTYKKIYRVTTHTGCIKVTEDHSLLNENLELKKPGELKVGDNLFNIKEFDTSDNLTTISKEKAFVYGLFFADGSCGFYHCPSGDKYSWAINKQDTKLLNRAKKYLEENDKDNEFKILDTMESSSVYKLVVKGQIKKYVMEYRKEFYDNHKYKKVPDCILNGSLEVKNAFFEGYYCGDGDKASFCRLDVKGQIGAMGLYYLMRSTGYNVSINNRTDKPDIYRLTGSITPLRKQGNKIKKINLMHLTYTDYVYDLETEAGVFHAGVGDLVVKNTDSNFINWNMINSKTGELMKGKHLVGLGIEMGKLVEKYIKPLLPFPHKWNYEKTFYPFCILAKKRYIGMKYEFSDDHCYLSYMGIVLKRRDNARIVKKVISGLINIMMEQVDSKDFTRIIDFMREQIEKILNGGYPLDDFELSKTLKANYADRSRMAHVVLADRVAERDPGNAFNLNDRVPFIYIEKKQIKGVKLLQGDMVETPEYIREKKLRVDYLFYITNQIMNPAVQLLEVLMPNPQALFDEYIKKENDRKKGVQGLEKWGIISTGVVDKNKKILEKPKEKKSLGKSRLPKPNLKPNKLMELKD